MTFAKFACELGAGRKKLGDTINHGVGLEFNHSVGDKIREGDVWLIVHHEDVLDSKQIEVLHNAIKFSNEYIECAERLICVI